MIAAPRRRWAVWVGGLCAAVCAGDGGREHLCVPLTAARRDVLRASNVFLPDPRLFVGAAPRDADAERLGRRLRRLGETCHAPFLPVPGTNAFGSHLNAAVLPLQYAVAHNRTMLTPPLGAYANGSCATLACFYRATAASCERAVYYPAGRPPRRAAGKAALAHKQARRKRATRCSDGKKKAATAPECGDYDAIEALGEAAIPDGWRVRAAASDNVRFLSPLARRPRSRRRTARAPGAACRRSARRR